MRVDGWVECVCACLWVGGLGGWVGACVRVSVCVRACMYDCVCQ